MMAVGEVPAVGEIHPEHGVTRFDDRRVGGLVGLRTGVGLHVRVFGAKEFLGAVAGQGLDHVDVLAAPVIAPSRVTLGVLVCEDASGGFQNCFRGEVFAGDQLQPGVLPLQLRMDSLVDLRVNLGQRECHPFLIRHSGVL